MKEGLEIPFSELSAEALRGVIEEFVLREGTDYGVQDASFKAKFDQVRRQLERREAKILFDPGGETVTLVRTK